MRIRLTLDIERTPRPQPQGNEMPSIYDVSGAQIEQSGPPSRIGFHMDPLDRPEPQYRGQEPS
jgi:hypothetical protein